MESNEEGEDLVEKLVYATAARNVREVENLMQIGIDPSTPTKRNGCSPLHTAAVLESPSGPEIVLRMLHFGADPDIKTPTGLSPLHIAAMWGRYQTINVLLDNGACVSEKDADDMSALDYAEEAEKNKELCIDALTRYRVNPRRPNRCFLTKSRVNLNKILGGHVDFSTFLSENSKQDDSLQHCGRSYNESMLSDSTDNIDDIMSDVSQLNIQEQQEIRTPVKPAALKSTKVRYEKEVICYRDTDYVNTTLNETMFHSCNDENLLDVAQSTMLEDLLLSDHSSVLKYSKLSTNCSAATTDGYSGDVSQYPEISSSPSLDDTFWSVKTALSSSSANESDKENRHKRCEEMNMDKTIILPQLTRRQKKSRLFVPLSPSVLNTRKSMSKIYQMESNPKTLDKTRSRKKEALYDEEQCFATPVVSFNLDHDPLCCVSDNCSSEGNGIDLLTEDTVNYSNNRSVPELIDYYEEHDNIEGTEALHEFDVKEETISESPTKQPKSCSHFVVLDCRQGEFSVNQRRSIDELSTITISYDWKDVSQLKATEELKDIAVVPTSIQTLTNNELRDRLLGLGENPGPIFASTRKVYQKHLARLEQDGADKCGKAAVDQRLKDYTLEMRQVLLNIASISKERGEQLEAEMALTFENPEKHTWREGTQKMSFNYILLDPRVTKNLPERYENLTSLEQFTIFAAAIFYIGKGKKSRPYEHFHEAVKFEDNKNNKRNGPSNKVSMILDIWKSGYGVTTVHVFHSVIPVEAYTREACMIEAMSLSRLTNAKRGDFYGLAASWPTKKRRHLGVHLLTKAMHIYLIEGEKQIKKRDILK